MYLNIRYNLYQITGKEGDIDIRYMNISICENEIEGVCLHAEKCIYIFTIHNLSRIFQKTKIF